MNWFRSYFNSGAQKCQVNFNEALSNASVLKCGVPHGSIIGPLLFLIYINGLPNCLSSASAKMFADDTNISCVAESLSDLEPCNIFFLKANNRSAFSSLWIVVNMAYQAELSEYFEETCDV